MKIARQTRIKTHVQPAPRWPWFMQQAAARIAGAGGWTTKRRAEPVRQLAAEIVKAGDGETFLKAARRGRPTRRQNLRYLLLREVEEIIGAAVPRRREDRNTPESFNAADRAALYALTADPEPAPTPREPRPGSGRRRKRPLPDLSAELLPAPADAGRLAPGPLV